MQFFFSKTTLSFYIEGMHDPVPEDAVCVSEEVFSRVRGEVSLGRIMSADADGLPCTCASPAKPPSPDAVLRGYVEEHLNSVAAGLGYDNKESLYRRVFTPGSEYHAEAVSFSEWADSCWSQTFRLLKGLGATRAETPAKDEFLATLPEYVFPG
jgi:hypothetical protein